MELDVEFNLVASVVIYLKANSHGKKAAMSAYRTLLKIDHEVTFGTTLEEMRDGDIPNYLCGRYNELVESIVQREQTDEVALTPMFDRWGARGFRVADSAFECEFSGDDASMHGYFTNARALIDRIKMVEPCVVHQFSD